MKSLLWVSILLCCGCKVSKTSPDDSLPCSQESTRAIATKVFAKQKQVEKLSITVSETDSTYVFDFELVDRYAKGIVGGGGKVTVSKQSCRVIQLRRYQ